MYITLLYKKDSPLKDRVPFVSDFIRNIIETNGLIPFYDESLTLHILNRKDYDSLMLNILTLAVKHPAGLVYFSESYQPNHRE